MPDNSEHELPIPWGPFLDELDEAISEPIALYCIGGFVVSLLYGLRRPTGDVDYIAVIPRYRMDELEQVAGPGSNLESKYKIHLQHVAVATMPEDYESRLREMFPGRFKKLKTLRPTLMILLYPSSSGTARRTKVMLNSWQKLCLLTQNSCRIDMTASCARI